MCQGPHNAPRWCTSPPYTPPQQTSSNSQGVQCRCPFHSTHHIVTNVSKYLNDGRLCSWSQDRASALILVDVARSSKIKQHAVTARGLECHGDGRSMQTPLLMTIWNPTCKLPRMSTALQTRTKSPCNHRACPCCQYANCHLLITSQKLTSPSRYPN